MGFSFDDNDFSTNITSLTGDFICSLFSYGIVDFAKKKKAIATKENEQLHHKIKRGGKTSSFLKTNL
ncbi:hypothetical protein FACS1894201_00780 [Bacteroidia bacterium]|nr:hypothetical protein FACS1894201_00780 [Bacteroidia bacterium]